MDRDSYCTPADWIDFARRVLGRIDLDPASNEHGQRTVQAGECYTKDDDGLAQEWYGRIWLNPPYSQPLCKLFTQRVVSEYASGGIDAAIVLVNTASETKWWQHLARSCTAFAFPGKRISFDHPEAGTKQQNRYAQTLFYFGEDLDAFIREAVSMGSLPVICA